MQCILLHSQLVCEITTVNGVAALALWLDDATSKSFSVSILSTPAAIMASFSTNFDAAVVAWQAGHR